jgi:hypothetical protein
MPALKRKIKVQTFSGALKRFFPRMTTGLPPGSTFHSYVLKNSQKQIPRRLKSARDDKK